ncbi:protein sidekick-2-like isoform X5 [Octopus sinensis]|uniref:Protein sidekick-2-like isoform X5 n=1 Tax=Octopus sinensis TaxID=2607531 RepID=A0A7E6ENT6_9MOLL|nr:protein sidekick-2-like isoform X5 [Octopus sinensis]
MTNRGSRLHFMWIFILGYLLWSPHASANEYITSLHKDKPSPPAFTEELKAGSVKKVGERQILSCRAFGLPTPTYSWLKNGQVFNDTTNSYIELELKHSDAGEYRCIAKNSQGSIISNKVHVEVSYISSFDMTSIPQTISANVGDPIILPVPPIESVPFPEITWFNGTKSLKAGSKRYDFTVNHSLVLLNLSPHDDGRTFHVRANNTLDEPVSSESFTIFITNPRNIPRIAPTIVVPPVDTTTNNNEITQFICIVNARPLKYNITWFRKVKNESILLTGPKYILSKYKRKLNIKNPTTADSGIYECVVQSNYPTVRASARLTVLVPPFIEADEVKSRPDYGSNVQLHCTAFGTPKPHIQWYLNAEEITSSNSKHRILPNGTLKINNVNSMDSGKYQCFAQNAAGETYKSFHLVVNSSPPEILGSKLKNQTVWEGSDVRLTVNVKGAPGPSVIWSRYIGNDWENISSTGRLQLVQPDLLLIANSKPDDTGFYKFVAFNEMGIIQSKMYLLVKRKTQISLPPQTQALVFGSTAILRCGVSSDPSVTVSWQWIHEKPPDNKRTIIKPSERHSIENGTLRIKSVNGIDVGNYTCIVTSSAGNDSRMASITVMEVPYPPIILNVFAHSNSPGSVSITWQAGDDGNSPITGYIIQHKLINQGSPSSILNPPWDTYQNTIDAQVRNYTVTGLQPASYYQFRIMGVNLVGEGRASEPAPDPPLLIPQQQAPSGPPRNLVGRPLSNSSVLINWLPPSQVHWNGPLTGYVIRYKPQSYNDKFAQQEEAGVKNQMKVITGLVTFTHYEIKIAARNAKGIGVFSKSITVLTEEGRPTAPPTNVTALAINSTVIEVKWKPPLSSQIFGLLLGYHIIARPIDKESGAETVSVQITVNSEKRYGWQEGYIGNLEKFANYRLTVDSYTLKGSGPESVPITVRTLEDFPDKVAHIGFKNVTDRSVVVIWKAPLKKNGILLGYILEYVEKNSTNVNSKPFSPQQLSYKIPSLKPTTVYTISVAARTRVGRGPFYSADVRSGFTPVPPGAPSSLGISNIHPRSCQLRFTPGFDGKTSITQWIIEAQVNSDKKWKKIYSVSAPDATTLRIPNLFPYTHYRLRIIAENTAGRSNHSEPSRLFQTSPAPPSRPPGNVTVQAINETAFRISWMLLTKQDWNGVPRGYEIWYKVVGRNESWTVVTLENAFNNYSYILNGLNEWVLYKVKMNSYNFVGKSPFSPVISQKTMESVPSSGPSNVTGEAVSSSSIDIQWGDVPLLEQNGQVLGYKIKYQAVDEGMVPKFQTVNNETRQYELRNLLKYVSYKINVLAFTKMGDGVLSEPTLFIRTKEDVPDPPIIIYFPNVTYEMAKVVWAPPKKPNGIILKYRVTYGLRANFSYQKPNYTIVNANVNSFTAYNLKKEKYYTFSVAAKTALGWGNASEVIVFTTAKRYPPESPSKPVESSRVWSRSITVSWHHGNDGYGPLRNFTIQYQKKYQQGWDTVKSVVPPTVTTYTITNLKPNTIYRFRVAATNDIGTSNFSESSDDVRTEEDKPEEAPQNVKVVAVSTNSVNVTWQPPTKSSWNGILKGYIVEYCKENNAEFKVKVSFDPNSSTIWKELTDLDKFVTYEFRILAYNKKGNGPTSKPVMYFVGYAPPSAAPLNVTSVAVSGSEIKVSWSPPLKSTQNGEISGYKVIYHRIFKNKSVDRKEITSLKLQVSLVKLKMYTEYSISVCAFTTAGQGPLTKPVIVRTKEGAPGAPGKLKFYNIMLHSLNVSWSEPSEPNGLIRYYHVIFSQKYTDAGGKKMVQLTIPGDRLYYHAKELEANKTYEFTVQAETIKLGAKQVGKVTTGPQIGSPTSPVTPQIEMTDRGVNITWRKGYEGDYPILGYLLQAKKQGDKKGYRKVCDCDPLSMQAARKKRESVKNSTTIRGKWTDILLKESPQTGALLNIHSLDTGKVYQFRVLAYNWLGIGPPSEPSKPMLIQDPEKGEIGKMRTFSERPFHTEWWFLLIIALSGLIVIMAVVLLLVLVGRKRKMTRETIRRRNTPPLPLEPPVLDDGGFSTFDRRQSRRTIGHRTNSLRSMRSPPRPSPASVTYSDDDLDTKPPLDDNSSSLTEKPDLEELTEPSDESEDETVKNTNTTTAGTFYNQYVNDTVRQSWQQSNPRSMYSAYNYTDSEEADSSTYGMNVNGGYMMVNNTAGSRTPVAGFSSFV